MCGGWWWRVVREAALDALAVLMPVDCAGCGAADRSLCDGPARPRGPGVAARCRRGSRFRGARLRVVGAAQHPESEAERSNGCRARTVGSARAACGPRRGRTRRSRSGVGAAARDGAADVRCEAQPRFRSGDGAAGPCWSSCAARVAAGEAVASAEGSVSGGARCQPGGFARGEAASEGRSVCLCRRCRDVGGDRAGGDQGGARGRRRCGGGGGSCGHWARGWP